MQNAKCKVQNERRLAVHAAVTTPFATLVRLLRRQEGTSPLEMALILPVFFMLVLGAADFGQSVALYNVTAEAARDGARSARVVVSFDDAIAAAGNAGAPSLESNITDPAKTAAVTQAAQSKVGAFGSKLTVNTSAGGDAVDGYYVRVTVQATYTPVSGTFLRIGAKNFAASSKLYLA